MASETMDVTALLERLASGAGVSDPRLLAGLEFVSAEVLAEQLAALGGHAACDVAYILARRHDPRGIAALARHATRLATAHRALHYLGELSMYDMVAPPLLTPEWRRDAEVVDLLGAEPDSLDEVFCRAIRWPERQEPAELRVYRFRFGDLPEGVVMLGPTPVRVDGGVTGLDDDDLLSLLMGRCFIARLVPLTCEQVNPDLVDILLRRRVYYYLSGARLERAFELGARSVLVISARQRRGPGFLVGDPRGDLPTHWLPRPAGDENGFDADHAAWLWLGRLLRSTG